MKIKIKLFFLKKVILTLIIFFFTASKSTAESPISLYDLKASKVIYENDKSLVIAEKDAYAVDQDGKEIFADKIIYDKKNFIIRTENKSIFKDQKGNKLFADNFIYNLNTKKIIAKNNVKFTDKIGNIFYFSKLEYNELTEIGNGENLKANLIDKSTTEGSLAEFNNKEGILTVGEKENKNILEKFLDIFKNFSNSYTPCENKINKSINIKERCPDWSIDTQKTVHDKENKMVYHYGSILKIKNIPVFYTPYFSHPDATVKRKSGFLPPAFKNFTNLGRSAKTPYFWDIADNKDLTITPVYYFDEKPLYMLEYRHQNKNNKFYIDTSYTEGYKNLNKRDENGNLISRTPGSRNHLFFNFLGNYDDILFQNNDLEINVQRISQKNYLNVNQINTRYVKQDVTNLNNNIILNSFEKNKKLTLRANIFEDINNDNANTKYQYVFPSIDFNNYFNQFNQFINFSSSFLAQNIGGDSNQSYVNNKIDTASEQKIFSFFDGMGNIIKTSINNLNSYNKNIINEKNNFNSDTYLTLGLENNFPLFKSDGKKEETIIPKILSKYTSGSMKNSSNENKILTYSDIHSMNRMNSTTNPETGYSLGYGIEYNMLAKNYNNEAYSKTNFTIGQVIKPEHMSTMPTSSTLNDTRSAFVGTASFFFDENAKNNEITNQFKGNKLNLNYDYTISKNFNKVLQNSVRTTLQNNNNYFTTFYHETHEISNQHYIDFDYTKKLDNNFNFSFGLRKNLQDKFTENNYIGANYDSDCLLVAINLTKKFYQNDELKPSNNLVFSIVFKPFGTSQSTDLSSFLK